MVSNFSASVGFRPTLVDIMNLGKLKVKRVLKSWGFQSVHGLIVVGSVLFLVGAIFSGCFYMFPTFQPVILNEEINRSTDNDSILVNSTEIYVDTECNLFEGKWVPDESYPLYNASQCPFSERGFNCLANGRSDKGYLKWRWQPENCDILRFDVYVILEWLRGKRVVFVGDSLSRTQWESMICMLMTGVEDKTSVFEMNGHRITRQIRYLGVRFSSFNFTVEFYRSIFLVQPGQAPKRAPMRVKTALKLDKMDAISKEWIDSDILIFNTGHWWNPTKLFNIGWYSPNKERWDLSLQQTSDVNFLDSGCYFQVGGRMKLGMSIAGGLKTALTTWKSWVESNIDPNKTRVFFRTFETTHWSGSQQRCKVTQQLMSKVAGKDKHPYSDAIIGVVKDVLVPVTVLHVTPMAAFRSDAHVGTWSDNPLVPDCSHWCLPGVPDMWNELLFSLLLFNQSP